LASGDFSHGFDEITSEIRACLHLADDGPVNWSPAARRGATATVRNNKIAVSQG
jgi:soluble cytochrome b562